MSSAAPFTHGIKMFRTSAKFLGKFLKYSESEIKWLWRQSGWAYDRVRDKGHVVRWIGVAAIMFFGGVSLLLQIMYAAMKSAGLKLG